MKNILLNLSQVPNNKFANYLQNVAQNPVGSRMFREVHIKGEVPYDTVTICRHPNTEKGFYEEIKVVDRSISKENGELKFGEPVETTTEFDVDGNPKSQIRMTRFGWTSNDFDKEGKAINERFYTYPKPQKFFGADGYFIKTA